jgi:ABC-type multidrug transport system fused ATPase/permease subunit
MDADRIYLFDKGEILEHGTYKELMQLKRHFYCFERGGELQNE